MTAQDNRHDRLVEDVRSALGAHEPGPERLGAMRAHLETAGVRGGTTLRDLPAPSRRWIAGGALAAAAAATLLFIMFIMPTVDRETTVSAAEILGRTRAALSTPTTGIEVLTYDLSVDGVLAEFLPVEQAGRFTVEETIDHDNPGRFRLLKVAEDGGLVAGLAEDPVSGVRTRYLRAHGRGYLLRFTGGGAPPFSLPSLKRMALQGFITLMQAETDQAVAETTCEGEPCYEITVPRSDAAPDALIALSHGRALITAADARLVEFSAAGQVAERPFGVEFRLRQRELRAASPDTTAFELTARPGDVVLQGQASSNPMWDVVERALAAIPQQPSR